MFPERAKRFESGGRSKAELLSSLRQAGISLNRYAEVLFDDPAFVTSETSRWVLTMEVTVAELGLTAGATSAEIFDR